MLIYGSYNLSWKKYSIYAKMFDFLIIGAFIIVIALIIRAAAVEPNDMRPLIILFLSALNFALSVVISINQVDPSDTYSNLAMMETWQRFRGTLFALCIGVTTFIDTYTIKNGSTATFVFSFLAVIVIMMVIGRKIRIIVQLQHANRILINECDAKVQKILKREKLSFKTVTTKSGKKLIAVSPKSSKSSNTKLQLPDSINISDSADNSINVVTMPLSPITE